MKSSTEQKNTYAIYDSMGRKTGLYVIASNVIEARKEAMPICWANKLGSYWSVKRCYNGGVRGSN